MITWVDLIRSVEDLKSKFQDFVQNSASRLQCQLLPEFLIRPTDFRFTSLYNCIASSLKKIYLSLDVLHIYMCIVYILALLLFFFGFVFLENSDTQSKE